MPATIHPALEGLNEPQQQAVLHKDGPALILAGAGSGKTKALTHRIAYLIDQGVPPWQILSVTFTNKAAKEMKSRIANMLHITEGESPGAEFTFNQSKLPVMGTFHSICVRILRKDIEHMGGDKKFVIYDSDDQKRLMKEILKSMAVDEKELKPRAALSYIGRFKSEALSAKEAEGQATTAHMQQVIEAYRKYQKALTDANAMDFDDLILKTVRLFTECPDVLERYQETWRYLHVDEYQDTNHAQYLFISLLSKKYRNLCVIGDPDQSIYSFRGADIRNILEFEKEHPDALRIKLEQNYRSSQPILTAADAVISANPNRPDKQMWTERKEGPQIVLNEVENERKEAEEAIKAAEQKRADGMSLNDQVILYRTNAQSRMFEEACMRSGIPYRIIGGVKFYARREVKDVLAYLYTILNPNDTLSLLRVINVPSRKIGLTTIGHMQAYASGNNMTLWETLQSADSVEAVNNPTKERIAQFVQKIRHFREKSNEEVVSHLTQELLASVGMEKWLRDDTEEGETRWQNVQELLSVMHKYDKLEPMLSLTSFLEEVALVSEVDSLQEASDDALTLMTLHLCKGLEYEHVMVAGCEEGIFPHSNSLFDRDQLEEERRIMYVGMTRAKTNLQLLYSRSRMLWGQTQANAPSRFLDDLPEEVIERRSDDVLSSFAWASKSGMQKTGGNSLQPFNQHGGNIDIEFNQDLNFEEESASQESDVNEGSRVAHPAFGQGTVVALRGDIAEVRFDSGQTKNFALSIAPLTPL